MSKRIDVMKLTEPVLGPPMKLFIRNTGGIVREPCVFIGYIDIDETQCTTLSALGINMTWAEYDRETERWERCLMSEAVADMLEELFLEGSFPYAFEVGLSRGEVAWITAQAEGATFRPELPLHQYLIPADPEALVNLADTASGTPRRLTRRQPRIER